MEINTNNTISTQIQNTKQNESNVKTDDFLKLLKLNDLGETELKKLTFEEAKEIQLQREKEGLKDNHTTTDGTAFGGHSLGSDSLLRITTLTDNDAFNKATFEKMKQKEMPSMYLNEIEHNMNHTLGKRAQPFPTLLVDELYGGFNPATKQEIKSIDLDVFIEQMISTYTQLLMNGTSHTSKEQTEQSLNDMKDIKENYNKYKNENKVLLETMRRDNKVNPLSQFINKDEVS